MSTVSSSARPVPAAPPSVTRITMIGAALVHFDATIRTISAQMRYPRTLAFGVTVYDDAQLAYQYVDTEEETLVHVFDLVSGSDYVFGESGDGVLVLRPCDGKSPLNALVS